MHATCPTHINSSTRPLLPTVTGADLAYMTSQPLRSHIFQPFWEADSCSPSPVKAPLDILSRQFSTIESCSSVSIARQQDAGCRVSIPVRCTKLNSSPNGPTQPPIQRVPGFLPVGKSAGTRSLTHLHLASTLRISGSTPTAPAPYGN
jgi:hypothetical protein